MKYRDLLEKYIINRIQNDIVTLDSNHWSPMYAYDPDGYITVRMNDELLVWCTPFMVDSDEIAFDMEEFEDGESTRSYSNREMLLTGDTRRF